MCHIWIGPLRLECWIINCRLDFFTLDSDLRKSFWGTSSHGFTDNAHALLNKIGSWTISSFQAIKLNSHHSKILYQSNTDSGLLSIWVAWHATAVDLWTGCLKNWRHWHNLIWISSNSQLCFIVTHYCFTQWGPHSLNKRHNTVHKILQLSFPVC